MKNAGTPCRTSLQECDLPEYCTGKSEYCPLDLYKLDGTLCGQEKVCLTFSNFFFLFFVFFVFFFCFFLVMILLGFITQRPIATRDLVVPILINVDYYGDLLARGLTLNVTTKILMATKQETVDISRLTTPLQNVLTSRLAFSYD